VIQRYTGTVMKTKKAHRHSKLSRKRRSFLKLTKGVSHKSGQTLAKRDDVPNKRAFYVKTLMKLFGCYKYDINELSKFISDRFTSTFLPFTKENCASTSLVGKGIKWEHRYDTENTYTPCCGIIFQQNWKNIYIMTPLLGYSRLKILKTRLSKLYSSDEADHVNMTNFQISEDLPFKNLSDFFENIEKTLPPVFQDTLRDMNRKYFNSSTSTYSYFWRDMLLMLYGCSKANKGELNAIFEAMGDFKTYAESLSCRQRNDPFHLLYRLVKWHTETETETYGIVVDVLTKAGSSSSFVLLTSEFKFETLRMPKTDVAGGGADDDVRIAHHYQISDSTFGSNRGFRYAVADALMKIRFSEMQTIHLEIPILHKTDEQTRMLGITVEKGDSLLSQCVVKGVSEEQSNFNLIQADDVLYEINKANIYTSHLRLKDIISKLSSLANRNANTTVDITVKRKTRR
jgi:hypothetical protein